MRWRFRWLLCGLLGLVLIGGAILWFREYRAVERNAQAARTAVASGRTVRAREPLNRWLRARPRSAEAHALRAELALAEGDFDQVKPEFNRARSLGYPEEKLERLRAIWSSRIGQYAEAEPVLARLWSEGANPDPAVDEALARIYLKTYRLAGAKTVIQRWIQDAPTDGRPFLWLTEIDRRTEVEQPGILGTTLPRGPAARSRPRSGQAGPRRIAPQGSSQRGIGPGVQTLSGPSSG